MINFTGYKNILWDFDGVLMDSMSVRDFGFQLVLSDYPKHEVQALMTYHRNNGGLSRYVKFRYFFNEIRKEPITDEQLLNLTNQFSKVMRQHLVNSELLIDDSVEFVKKNYNRYRMHIVSGSDQEELRFICSKLGLSQFFHSIHGSPEVKDDLIRQLIKKYSYDLEETLMIGDSQNDQAAAVANAIAFWGYNNLALKSQCTNYIKSFKS